MFKFFFVILSVHFHVLKPAWWLHVTIKQEALEEDSDSSSVVSSIAAWLSCSFHMRGCDLAERSTVICVWLLPGNRVAKTRGSSDPGFLHWNSQMPCSVRPGSKPVSGPKGQQKWVKEDELAWGQVREQVCLRGTERFRRMESAAKRSAWMRRKWLGFLSGDISQSCLVQAVWKVSGKEPAREFQEGITELSPSSQAAVADKWCLILTPTSHSKSWVWPAEADEELIPPSKLGRACDSPPLEKVWLLTHFIFGFVLCWDVCK